MELVVGEKRLVSESEVSRSVGDIFLFRCFWFLVFFYVCM